MSETLNATPGHATGRRRGQSFKGAETNAEVI